MTPVVVDELELRAELWRRARRRGQQEQLPSNVGYAQINISTAGDNVIIAGAAGSQIGLQEVQIWNSTLQTFIFKDGMTEFLRFTSYPALSGWTRAFNMESFYVLTAGSGLVINLSGAGQVDGFVRYTLL